MISLSSSMRFAARPAPSCASPADRIARPGHDDRNRRGCLLGGKCRWRPEAHDHVHLEPRKFDREIRPPLEASLRPTGVEGEILTLHVAQFAKPLPQWLPRHVAEEIDFGYRLRLDGERRGKEHRTRASEEGATVHY